MGSSSSAVGRGGVGVGDRSRGRAGAGAMVGLLLALDEVPKRAARCAFISWTVVGLEMVDGFDPRSAARASAVDMGADGAGDEIGLAGDDDVATTAAAAGLGEGVGPAPEPFTESPRARRASWIDAC